MYTGYVEMIDDDIVLHHVAHRLAASVAETVACQILSTPHAPDPPCCLYHIGYYAALLLKEGAAYCVALSLSVCLSVCLSVRPVLERHLAPPSELQ